MSKSLFLVSMSSFFFGLFGVSWEKVDAKIDREFPQVQFIENTELDSLYRTGQQPIVVDVREAEEYAVSHLRDAVHLESGVAIAEQFPDKTAAIVVYCSVGYRSAAVAEQLAELGYGNVRNLRHSIFDWAERGLALTNGQTETSKVHPFNRIWGRLVSKELHAYQP